MNPLEPPSNATSLRSSHFATVFDLVDLVASFLLKWRHPRAVFASYFDLEEFGITGFDHEAVADARQLGALRLVAATWRDAVSDDWRATTRRLWGFVAVELDACQRMGARLDRIWMISRVKRAYTDFVEATSGDPVASLPWSKSRRKLWERALGRARLSWLHLRYTLTVEELDRGTGFHCFEAFKRCEVTDADFFVFLALVNSVGAPIVDRNSTCARPDYSYPGIEAIADEVLSDLTANEPDADLTVEGAMQALEDAEVLSASWCNDDKCAAQAAVEKVLEWLPTVCVPFRAARIVGRSELMILLTVILMVRIRYSLSLGNMISYFAPSCSSTPKFLLEHQALIVAQDGATSLPFNGYCLRADMNVWLKTVDETISLFETRRSLSDLSSMNQLLFTDRTMKSLVEVGDVAESTTTVTMDELLEAVVSIFCDR